MVNNCVDPLQQYDTGAASDTLNQAYNTMHSLYICFWISMGFLFAEFMFWVVFAVDARMSRVARDELSKGMKIKVGDPDHTTVVLIDPNAGGGYPGDPPMMAAPGVTTTAMMQPG